MDDLPPHEHYVLDVLLNCAVGTVLPKDRNDVTATPGGVTPCTPGQKGMPLVVPVLLTTIEGISHIRIFLPKDLRQDQARETVWKSVLEVQRRFPDGIALLDPIQNMDIKDDRFKALVKVRLNRRRTLFILKTWFVIPENRRHGTQNVLEPPAQGS
jgi:ATP-dependent RNA helicase DOB1